MKESIPTHVGVIMDGNGRWAKERGMIRSMGHKEGAKNLKTMCEHAYQRGVKFLSVYAFSTENFKREKTEVDFLMNLFEEVFRTEFNYLKEKNVKILFSGRKEPLGKKILQLIDQMQEETKDNTGLVFHVCFNYGGQLELVDMVRRVAQKVRDGELAISDISKEVVEENLYQALPPLDFVIRTSGEQRISNFMLWQSAYAEYYFPKVYFPDFDEKEFDLALEAYQARNRRFGGTK